MTTIYNESMRVIGAASSQNVISVDRKNRQRNIN